MFYVYTVQQLTWIHKDQHRKDDEVVEGVTLDKMKVSESKVIDLVIKLL